MDIQSVKKILDDWQQRIARYQDSHHQSAVRLEKYHYLVGLPTAVLAAITSATVFTNLDQQMSVSTKFWVGAISLIATVLAGVQTFYNFSKRSESHRSVAVQFGHIRREIDILKEFPPEDRSQLEAKIRELNEIIGRVSTDAPTIEAPLVRRQLDGPDGFGGSSILLAEPPSGG